jgi:hypothetical protein
MIFNINFECFGGAVRNGDLIAVGNIVEYLRKHHNDETIKFFMRPGSVNESDYVQLFFKFLKEKTDYFSDTPGNVDLPWKRVNIWDFRDISGDLVKIVNTKKQEKKIVIFPIFDAPYNVYRNWPAHEFEKVLTWFNGEEYNNYEKIVCISPNINFQKNIDGWTISKNFMENINHIMTSEIFVGGDTGTSHFAWSLDKGPKNLMYFNSSRSLVHCLPFYLIEGKGKFIKYWLNNEGTTWN